MIWVDFGRLEWGRHNNAMADQGMGSPKLHQSDISSHNLLWQEHRDIEGIATNLSSLPIMIVDGWRWCYA